MGMGNVHCAGPSENIWNAGVRPSSRLNGALAWAGRNRDSPSRGAKRREQRDDGILFGDGVVARRQVACLVGVKVATAIVEVEGLAQGAGVALVEVGRSQLDVAQAGTGKRRRLAVARFVAQPGEVAYFAPAKNEVAPACVRRVTVLLRCRGSCSSTTTAEPP